MQTAHPRKGRAATALSRRRFLRAAGSVAGAFTLVPRHVLGGSGFVPPSEKVSVAFIGAGGQAMANINALVKESVHVGALCDVDAARAATAFKRFPDVPKYTDFRQMLDREKSVDAVVVSTPDHTHAPASLMAVRLGKHVYCEKPLTHSVYEARMLAQAVAEEGVATQFGTQGQAFEGPRRLREWIADGAIGPVREVHVWSNRPGNWWPQGIRRPGGVRPVPAGLDWNLWLGPAPYRPYSPAYAPFKWRGWWDFGNGPIGDMGIHDVDPVVRALRLGPPTSVEATSSPLNGETLPLACLITYRFPARGEMPPVELRWYDGGLLPPRPVELEDGRKMSGEDGVILVGEKGKILTQGWGSSTVRLIPEAAMEAYEQPPKTIPKSIGHHKEWIEACKGGPPTGADFAYAGPLTEMMLLGTIAVRVRKKLYWDASKMEFPNEPDANAYLRRDYREGWESLS